MQSIITIAALLLAIPTYGISLLFLIWYTVSTGKARRNQIFYQIIREAYTRPGENYVTNKVYYEAAERFAKENAVGVASPGGDSISADVMLGNEKVAVWFGKDFHGNLIVSVENAEAQTKRVLGDSKAKDSDIPIPKGTKESLEVERNTSIINGLLWTEDIGMEMNWEEAMKYAEDLRLGGYNNWRLPTVDELGKVITLCGGHFIMVEEDRYKNKVDLEDLFNSTGKKDNNDNSFPFDYALPPIDEKVEAMVSANKENKNYQTCCKEKGFIAKDYWSSTIHHIERCLTDETYEEKKWFVSFDRGDMGRFLISGSCHVRCVRDMQ